MTQTTGGVSLPWAPLTQAIAEVTREVTPTLAGQAAAVAVKKGGAKIAATNLAKAGVGAAGAKALGVAGGAPFVTSLVVTSALQLLIAQHRATKGNPLEYIKADTEALVRAPFLSGMHYIEMSTQTADAERRQEYIQKAIDKFVDAQATLEARNQPRDLFGKAIAQFHMGYCQTLLGYYEEAGASCQGAYISATNYLLSQGTPVRATWDQYMEYEGLLNTTFAKRLGMAAGTGALAGAILPLAIPGTLITLGVTAGNMVAHLRAQARARERFMEEATPALELVQSLQRLSTEAPDLPLAIEQPSLTADALDARLRGS